MVTLFHMKDTSKIVLIVIIALGMLSACSGSKKSKCNTCPKWSKNTTVDSRQV